MTTENQSNLPVTIPLGAFYALVWSPVVALFILLCALGVARADVTAAVTQGGDGPFVMQDSIFEHKAVPVMDGTFHVVITNEKNGRSAAWKQFSYITARECDRAIVGIDDALRAVANPDPEVVPQPPVHADPKLVDQVVSLLAAVVQNTGVMPSLSIACEADGI